MCILTGYTVKGKGEGMQSERKKAYDAEYKKKVYKQVPLKIRFEDYNAIVKHCDAMNESVQGFIKRAINETMVNDLKPPTR